MNPWRYINFNGFSKAIDSILWYSWIFADSRIFRDSWIFEGSKIFRDACFFDNSWMWIWKFDSRFESLITEDSYEWISPNDSWNPTLVRIYRREESKFTCKRAIFMEIPVFPWKRRKNSVGAKASQNCTNNKQHWFPIWNFLFQLKNWFSFRSWFELWGQFWFHLWGQFWFRFRSKFPDHFWFRTQFWCWSRVRFRSQIRFRIRSRLRNRFRNWFRTWNRVGLIPSSHH